MKPPLGFVLGILATAGVFALMLPPPEPCTVTAEADTIKLAIDKQDQAARALLVCERAKRHALEHCEWER